jgi:hypothetical protein
MADDVTLPGSGAVIAADEISSVKYQRNKLSLGADGVANDAIPVSAGLDSTAVGVQAVGLVAQLDDTSPTTVTENQFGPVRMSARRALLVEGPVAHDLADAANPVKTGSKAVAHGANPTAVAAGDVVDRVANRAGVPFVIGGHPNVVTLKHTTITTAVTDAAIITVSAGTKIVVTSISVSLDNASTIFPTVLIGFGTANTPTTTGVIFAHGGFPAGGQASRGDGSGIIGIGGDGEDLRVTTTGNATGNGLQIVVTYYTIES